MSLMMNVLIWVLVLLACVALILWAYMNVRARRIAARLGAFRCWSRPDHHAGWTAGIGVYGVEELSLVSARWHVSQTRLFGASARDGGVCPDLAFRRRFHGRGAPGLR